MYKALTTIVVLLSLPGVVFAGELASGDREISLRASYSDVDYGTGEGAAAGFDLGSSEETELALTCGWMVTDRHQFGVLVGYLDQSIKGGDFGPNESTDGTQLGGFYTYNLPAGEMLTPYAGVTFSTLGGDLGDAYDFSYGAEVGLKIYPFEHGGLSVGLSYTELRADAEDLPDADGISLGVGLLIKF